MLVEELAPEPNPESLKHLRNKFDYIKQRCYNEKCASYSHYGERGIDICSEWLNDPNLFIIWSLKKGYNKKLTIERIDVNKGYSPQNCKWVKPSEQYWNRTDTVTNREKKTRICQRCKIEKQLDKFHKNKSKPLGHHYICKDCRNEIYEEKKE